MLCPQHLHTSYATAVDIEKVLPKGAVLSLVVNILDYKDLFIWSRYAGWPT